MPRDADVKKLILIGRSEAGKTTLIQALRGERLHYEKTQAVLYGETILDTPGEYAQTARLGGALAVYSYEADVIGLVLSATEPYSLFPPNIVQSATRPVIGIVTKCDAEGSSPRSAELWLREAGCERIFFVSSRLHRGVDEILSYLNEGETTQNKQTPSKNQTKTT